ncbi:MAG: hypothetical protein K9K86_07180 [Pseudomonadales bacterium]|nr:hypothetical protein [Pseudomonadales bacterium]
MKRIGFVGLSTPIYYDYRYKASRSEADLSSSPNPILEGAFGALLLYDEIWFLTKSLCPDNMRHLSYVRFLNEEGKVPEVDPNWLPDGDTIFHPTSIEEFRNSSADYEMVKQGAGIYWDAAADNHTHGIKIGEAVLGGNSWSLNNVIYDILMTERLPNNVELLTNSFSTRLFRSESSLNDQLKLTELLILENVPQFICPKGPYHPCVEEVRESAFLKSFRAWMNTEALSATGKEIKEIKDEVDSKLEEAERDLFLKFLAPKETYKSLGETLLSVGADALVPGSAAVKDLLGQLNEEKQKKGVRWQGFIVEARAKIRKS